MGFLEKKIAQKLSDLPISAAFSGLVLAGNYVICRAPFEGGGGRVVRGSIDYAGVLDIATPPCCCGLGPRRADYPRDIPCIADAWSTPAHSFLGETLKVGVFRVFWNTTEQNKIICWPLFCIIGCTTTAFSEIQIHRQTIHPFTTSRNTLLSHN